MPEVAFSTHFTQELRSAHALMMQCAASAERLLGRDRPAGSPRPVERAELEAARMAGLFARLGESFGRGALLSGRLPAAAVDTAAEGPAAVESAASPPAPRLHAAPGTPRGRLKNGNPSGDYLKSPRCGARARSGGCCRQPAMANGRCRMHGGLSIGPRTPEGLARCRVTRLVHGCRTRAHIALRSRAAHAARRLRALTRELSARVPAGHLPAVRALRRRLRAAGGLRQAGGVHRSDSIVARRRAAWLAARRRARAASARAQAGVNPAGHGVHRSDSIHHRDHRGHREGMIARCARQDRPENPTSVRSVSSVVNPSSPKPSSAGHGLHRSFRDHLRSSASICGSQTFPLRPTAGVTAAGQLR